MFEIFFERREPREKNNPYSLISWSVSETERASVSFFCEKMYKLYSGHTWLTVTGWFGKKGGAFFSGPTKRGGAPSVWTQDPLARDRHGHWQLLLDFKLLVLSQYPVSSFFSRFFGTWIYDLAVSRRVVIKYLVDFSVNRVIFGGRVLDWERGPSRSRILLADCRINRTAFA